MQTKMLENKIPHFEPQLKKLSNNPLANWYGLERVQMNRIVKLPSDR